MLIDLLGAQSVGQYKTLVRVVERIRTDYNGTPENFQKHLEKNGVVVRGRYATISAELVMLDTLANS